MMPDACQRVRLLQRRSSCPFAPSSRAQSPRMSCSTTTSRSHSSTIARSFSVTCSSCPRARRDVARPSRRRAGPFFDGSTVAAAVKWLGADGSFVAMNNAVSQSVAHLHVHVVPRRRKDGLRGFFSGHAAPVSATAKRGGGGEAAGCARLSSSDAELRTASDEVSRAQPAASPPSLLRRADTGDAARRSRAARPRAGEGRRGRGGGRRSGSRRCSWRRTALPRRCRLVPPGDAFDAPKTARRFDGQVDQRHDVHAGRRAHGPGKPGVVEEPDRGTSSSTTAPALRPRRWRKRAHAVSPGAWRSWQASGIMAHATDRTPAPRRQGRRGAPARCQRHVSSRRVASEHLRDPGKPPPSC